MKYSGIIHFLHKNLLIIIVWLIAFLMPYSGLQAQYYVSPSGSDSNPGTLQMPFKTIQKAAGIMLAGETCFIM